MAVRERSRAFYVVPNRGIVVNLLKHATNEENGKCLFCSHSAQIKDFVLAEKGE